jgi:hypothetical protein
MSHHNFPEPTPEIIKECKEWLARREAQLDQRKKMFEDQYPLRHPFDNLQRMDDLEVMEFRIDIHKWELEETIKSMKETED